MRKLQQTMYISVDSEGYVAAYFDIKEAADECEGQVVGIYELKEKVRFTTEIKTTPVRASPKKVKRAGLGKG